MRILPATPGGHQEAWREQGAEPTPGAPVMGRGASGAPTKRIRDRIGPSLAPGNQRLEWSHGKLPLAPLCERPTSRAAATSKPNLLESHQADLKPVGSTFSAMARF